MKTNLDKKAVESERDLVYSELKRWTLLFEKAQAKVEYWKRQADAISLVSIRVSIGENSEEMAKEFES